MDTVQRFMFDEAPIRGEIAHLNQLYSTLINQRPYPPLIKQILGEALVCCVLMVSHLKFHGELNLQFQGDDRFPLLVVQCNSQLEVRAFAKYQDSLTTEEYAGAFLKGTLGLIINQYQSTQSYQSMVAIQSTSMAENIMYYFAQSEQLATQVWLAVNENKAAGIFLQLMPHRDSTKEHSAEREQFWEYAVQLGQTVTPEELLELDNQTLLYRLYNEATVRLFEERLVHFKCRCNQQKMQQVLSVLGEADIKQLLAEQGKITTTCDFCNSQYTFDAIDIALLFHHK